MNSNYERLERQLVLLAWLNSLLGYSQNRDLLKSLNDEEEGFDASGRSYICQRLGSRGKRLKISESDLIRYDNSIREHLTSLSENRGEQVTLRYFQYLALLYTEIFLDWKFNCPRQLLQSLNKFAEDKVIFWEDDLNKLAYWMATGSGKTLIMHINYWQFLQYEKSSLDNILLITPNEGLSEQHMQEMVKSGIPCRRFDLHENEINMTEHLVRVIEITKLVHNKKSEGVSVPVEAFEGKNLIFVDEGHKGAGGDVWRSAREAISETGFTFEYSATFGQALMAANNNELTKQYGKAIIFDYSYRYFHGDGYGKDFRVLNLQEETDESHTELLILANLLSFYEQQSLFEHQEEVLRPYSIEKPLWVFVGSRVNAVYTQNSKKRSDVLTIIKFMHRLLADKDWAIEQIQKLLKHQSGLNASNGTDLFASRFKTLRETPSEQVYTDVLLSVFHAPQGGQVHLCNLHGHDGEIGLKVSGAEDYFGLIYIGDVPQFKKLVEADPMGIVWEDDAVSNSLFESINSSKTSVEILIGAKKFMEGWNSWRVSSMGLLNIGRKEGSEIIQLFGRGVRLRGKGMTLKRSAALEGQHPADMTLLETLNIFSIRANYMNQFRAYLENEGVEIEDDVVLSLPIRTNWKFLNKGLKVPRVPRGKEFLDQVNILLEVDSDLQVHVDASARFEELSSSSDGLMAGDAVMGEERFISQNNLELVDWEKAYFSLLEYKANKGMSNLVIRFNVPEAILSADNPRLYRLIVDDSTVKPNSYAGVNRLNEVVQIILRKYMDKFYRVHQESWETDNMTYMTLRHDDANFQDYVVTVPGGDSELIASIKGLITQANKLYTEDVHYFPTIHFDRHLYQPLLVADEKVKSTPVGLHKSERDFVSHLREYLHSRKNSMPQEMDVFLLRNLSRGKGVGFFEKRGFYPDFILWLLSPNAQRIVFVEPHGMIHAGEYENDEKAKLHEKLPTLARKMNQRDGVDNIELDSFIVSSTPYDDLYRKYGSNNWDRKTFAEKHILFQERNDEYDYIEKIMR